MTEAEREEALEVLQTSYLPRRRLAAADKLDRRMSAREMVALFLLLAGLFVLGRLLENPGHAVASTGTPVEEVAPPENSLGRFCYRHNVRVGETFWQISQEYYGSGKPANISILQEANPALDKDPKKLFIAKTVMVPLREGGCQ